MQSLKIDGLQIRAELRSCRVRICPKSAARARDSCDRGVEDRRANKPRRESCPARRSRGHAPGTLEGFFCTARIAAFHDRESIVPHLKVLVVPNLNLD